VIEYEQTLRVGRVLERVVVILALGASVYRATLYWLLPPAAGEPYGTGDIIDFALGLLVFLTSGLCAAAAVATSMSGDGSAQHLAFRPAVIGITSFVIYYFVHPYVPRLF